MPIPSGVIVGWPSTAGTIPSGWTRETTLDARYIRVAAAAADADLTTAFGSATHNHTSPSHTPIQNSHANNVSGANVGAFALIGPGVQCARDHAHASNASNGTTATNNGIAITVDNFTNDLSRIEVIFIKSDGSPTGIPSGALAFFGSDALPGSFARAHGDRYFKGAAAAGDGGTTAGSNTHTHTSPAHTHTQNSHTHSATTATPSNAGESILSEVIDLAADDNHTHSLTLNATTATNQSVTTVIDSASQEPPYKKLNTIVNNSASNKLPTSAICIWGGTNASIPAGWSRVTSMDGQFPKGANANGESLVTTGGATTHVHTAASCTPIQNSHTHTATNLGTNGTQNVTDVSSASAVINATHNHSWTVIGTVATNQAAAVTIDANTSESAYPLYRKVIFIEYTGPAVGYTIIKNILDRIWPFKRKV